MKSKYKINTTNDFNFIFVTQKKSNYEENYFFHCSFTAVN